MDHSIEQMAEEAEKLIQRGATVYQRFTCSKCHSRQTMDKPNTFYTEGVCEECKHTTDIKKVGCGYTLVLSVGKKNEEK
jgi:hypothetical protein